MEKEILVVGSLNMDLVIRVARMPRVGETVLGKDLTYSPGGKGANQALAAAKLGGKTAMLGCVGDDNFGRIQMQNLAGAGVDISGLKIGKKPTGAAAIYVDERGSNSIAVIQGANLECDIPYIKEHDDLLFRCGCVMLQMEIPLETIFFVIRRAKEYGKTVILNPAPAPARKSLPDEIYPLIDYITPNENELRMLSGRRGESGADPETGARRLLSLGVKNVLVTMGESGALLANRDKVERYPARKAEAVDTTAAGDCFNGALAAALAKGAAVGEAIRFANAAASVSVSRPGAQSSIPRAGEVMAALGEEKPEDRRMEMRNSQGM